MAEPEPELLSLLYKVANPLESISVKVKLHGIYAPPEQWYTHYYIKEINRLGQPKYLWLLSQIIRAGFHRWQDRTTEGNI